ncbi:MAG: glutamate 5-kinase [Deinococcus sp.]|nr:glutamate 5-kinase [Deinococcus sp.]
MVEVKGTNEGRLRPRRLVVKVGSSTITDERGMIAPPQLWALARGVQAWGAQVAVVSSGAIAAGRWALGLDQVRTLPKKQAAAAVGQALVMLDWARAFAPTPVGQILLTHEDFQARRRYLNARNTFEALFSAGAVPIVNENDAVATAEIKFGDNDTLSAWTAYLIEAELLILLTDIDGLYTADPHTDPNAQLIPEVPEITPQLLTLAGGTGSSRGTGGMVTKLRAARIATDAGIPVIIAGVGGQALERLAAGEKIGTYFHPRSRRSGRQRWIAGLELQGAVQVDAGAVKALRQGRSLLPSGVTGVEGDFGFGEAVRVVGPEGEVARGLVNYPAEELRSILGHKTSEIAQILGHKDYDEVIHRDNMVLTPSLVDQAK